MIRDITLGQYFPGESFIHRLDPRTKIMMTFGFILALFLVDNFIGFIIGGIGLAMVIAVSKVPIGFIVRGLKPVFLIIIFTFVINMFMTPGDLLFEFGFLKISEQGLRNAFFMAVRLVLLIFGSTMLTLTTKPISLTDGIEYLLKPLKAVGVPAHELAMMMTIALRFIPTLLEETDKIMKAQAARGADFESGNILKRGKNLIPILVPLFISAFRIAQDLAMAMESRCYRGGDHRTRLHSMKFKKGDVFTLVLMLMFIVLIAVQSHIL